MYAKNMNVEDRKVAMLQNMPQKLVDETGILGITSTDTDFYTYKIDENPMHNSDFPTEDNPYG